jgi:hypothetical protein
MVDARTVDGLVTAYQRALERGRGELGEGWELRILQAAVVENARAAQSHLVTFVAGGDALTKRLDAFLANAEKNDLVGKAMAKAASYGAEAASTVASEVVGKAFGLSAMPTLTAIGGAVVAWAGWLQGIGRAIGAGIVAIVVGIVALAQRSPQVVTRSVQLVAGWTQTAQIPQWSTSGFRAAVGTVGKLGRGAEQILESELAAPARALFGQSQLPGWSVPSKIRGSAQAVLYIAVTVIAIAAFIMIGGIVEGIQQGLEDFDPCALPRNTCPPELPTLSPPF